MGTGNSSFGLPNLDSINSAFAAVAIASGVSCLIANVARLRQIVLAVDLLMGRESYAERCTKAHKQR